MKIVGSYLSPYVRNVLVALDMKSIAYEIDPIIPFLGDERSSALSPLRRIPVLIDDNVTLSDSALTPAAGRSARRSWSGCWACRASCA